MCWRPLLHMCEVLGWVRSAVHFKARNQVALKALPSATES